MVLQDADELTRLRNRFLKTPMARSQRDSRLLDFLEDLVEPMAVVALGTVVVALSLMRFAWQLLAAILEIASDTVRQLG